jgi:hypothetical protein
MDELGNIYISIFDFVLLPFYVGLIYIIAYRMRNSKYPRKHPWRKYFIPALSVKIFGAIFIGFIFAYYYKVGDTFYYFSHAQALNKVLNESVSKWFNLVLHIPAYNDPNYADIIPGLIWYNDPASYTVAAITSVISVFTFTTYFPTTVIFAFISFTGLWALFRTFASLYPRLTRPIAIAVLFIPSVFVWGSGIFKDTVCIFGLGWLTYSTFRMLVQKDFSIRNLLVAVLSFTLIAKVKLYILLAFTPALLMWILFTYSQQIRNKSAKLLVKFVFVAAVVVGFLFFMQRFAKELGKFSLEKVVQTSEATRGYIYYVSGDEGSAYSLGNFDPSIGNMLSKFPLAVNVTLFRPYPWEAKKIIVLLSALEALLFLFLTLKILFQLGIVRIWQTIGRDPTIQFCLIFSIIFAFAVGISTYNFGALSRYKIPCLPFYALSLLLIYYKNAKPGRYLFRPLKI